MKRLIFSFVIALAMIGCSKESIKPTGDPENDAKLLSEYVIKNNDVNIDSLVTVFANSYEKEEDKEIFMKFLVLEGAHQKVDARKNRLNELTK